jgi:hypothetical protein
MGAHRTFRIALPADRGTLSWHRNAVVESGTAATSRAALHASSGSMWFGRGRRTDRRFANRSHVTIRFTSCPRTMLRTIRWRCARSPSFTSANAVHES